MIWYLNDAWQAAHGGELVLYPFPWAPVVIPPRADQLVVFSSTDMLHRVLPSHASRFCATVWCSRQINHTTTPPPAPPPNINTATDAELMGYLLHPRLRQHVARWFYAAEWRQSMCVIPRCVV